MRPVTELAAIVRRGHVSIGVVATPASAAQAAADRLVAAGVTSILNFAAVLLTVPPSVSVRKVDLAVELQILSYYEQRRVAAAAVACRGPTSRTAGRLTAHVDRRHRCEPPHRSARRARTAGHRS